MRRRWIDLWVLGAAAVGFGAAIAAVAAAAGGTAAAGSSSDRFIAGAHLPPLLTLPGEQVTLRYAIVCSPADPVAGTSTRARATPVRTDDSRWSAAATRARAATSWSFRPRSPPPLTASRTTRLSATTRRARRPRSPRPARPRRRTATRSRTRRPSTSVHIGSARLVLPTRASSAQHGAPEPRRPACPEARGTRASARRRSMSHPTEP